MGKASNLITKKFYDEKYSLDILHVSLISPVVFEGAVDFLDLSFENPIDYAIKREFCGEIIAFYSQNQEIIKKNEKRVFLPYTKAILPFVNKNYDYLSQLA